MEAMMGNRAAILIVCLGLGVAACNSYPPLATAIPVSPNGPQDVTPALAEAQRLQGDYVSRYEDVTKHAWKGQLPIILAAGVAAGLLIANPANVANLVAYTGIAAGTFELGRNAIAPRGMPLLYAQGAAALQCTINEGGLFTSNAPGGQGTPLERLRASGIALAEEIDRSESVVALAIPEGGTTEERTAALKHQKDLSSLLVEARALLVRANEEVSSGSQAGPVVASAVSAVALRVATKGQEGRAISYQEALDQLKPKPATGNEEMVTESGIVAGVASFAGEVDAATTALRKKMTAVQGDLRPYKAALDRVRACPNGVGT
jgi:hypothetical protein